MLTKRMQAVLDEEPETTKRRTVVAMAKLGIVEIIDSWIVRAGVPGAPASGSRPGQWVTIFRRITQNTHVE